MNPPQWSGWDDPRDKTDRMNDPYGNQMTSICTMQVIEDNDTGAARTATIQLKSGDNVLATYEITQPAADPKKDIYNIDFGTLENEATLAVTNTLTAEQWGIGTYELGWLTPAFDNEGNNAGLQISASGRSKDYETASGSGNLYFLASVPADGVIPAETIDPSFVITIPEATVSGASYLYLNFGSWARVNYGKGSLVAEVIFNSNTSTVIEPSWSTAGSWQYFENRITIPEGTTSCAVKFYAKNGSDWNGETDASSNFRIDDVNIAIRVAE